MREVGIEVREREILRLIGVGKTTLLKILSPHQLYRVVPSADMRCSRTARRV